MQGRMRMTSFNDTVSDYREQWADMRHIPFEFQIPDGEIDRNHRRVGPEKGDNPFVFVVKTQQSILQCVK